MAACMSPTEASIRHLLSWPLPSMPLMHWSTTGRVLDTVHEAIFEVCGNCDCGGGFACAKRLLWRFLLLHYAAWPGLCRLQRDGWLCKCGAWLPSSESGLHGVP